MHKQRFPCYAGCMQIWLYASYVGSWGYLTVDVLIIIILCSVDVRKQWLDATIPDKTTWEFVSLHAHYWTQQHYYNNNWFAVQNPPPPQVNVVSYKCLRIRVALEHTTTLLPRGGGKGGHGIVRMLGKMLCECDIFSMVLSKIVCMVFCIFQLENYEWPNEMVLRAILQESGAKLEMKIFNPPSIFVWR